MVDDIAESTKLYNREREKYVLLMVCLTVYLQGYLLD